MTKGIDISEFQDSINYDKLKEDGIEFVIIRCGYGKNEWQKDSLFEQHYANCKRLGIKVGAYLFSYANTIEGASLEADNCIRFIQGKSFELPIFYDVEDDGTTGQADKFTLTKMCETFCNKLIDAGYQAGIYASLYWFEDKMYVEELEKYNIWLAQWNDKITANFRVDIWQYTSDGNINAVGGRVDMNNCYKFYPYDNPKRNTDIKKFINKDSETPIYSDTYLGHMVGYLDAGEVCECYEIFENRAVVFYRVNGTDIYKVGYTDYIGGIQW